MHVNITNESLYLLNKVGNPLVADRNVINVFESLEVCVLYDSH